MLSMFSWKRFRAACKPSLSSSYLVNCGLSTPRAKSLKIVACKARILFFSPCLNQDLYRNMNNSHVWKKLLRYLPSPNNCVLNARNWLSTTYSFLPLVLCSSVPNPHLPSQIFPLITDLINSQHFFVSCNNVLLFLLNIFLKMLCSNREW